MSATAKQTLMGYEINRARLRILSPIGEDVSLSPIPEPKPKEDEELKYPRDHQLVLISDQMEGFEPSSPDLIPPVPAPAPLFDQRSRDLDTLVNRYLINTRPPNAHRSHNAAFCECCENVNTVNREKRKAYWGKQPQMSEHDADPGRLGLDLHPYGIADRNIDQDRPIHEGRYQLLYPTLAERAAAPAQDTDGGSATLQYAYLPDNYYNYTGGQQPIALDSYYNSWGTTRNVTNPPYERHLAEDVMQAASNYDAAMGRLKHTVGLFENKIPHGSFS